jgi:hypothetical protein
VFTPIGELPPHEVTVRFRERDVNGWGLSVKVDVQEISLGDNSGAPFEPRSLLSLVASALFVRKQRT